MGPINIVFEYQIILISGKKSMQPIIEIVSDAVPMPESSSAAGGLAAS